jgi:peptide/nickel transport system substrate-binding protein
MHLKEDVMKRILLFVVLTSVLAVALAACGEKAAAPAAQIIEVPKEIIVEKEVIREVPVVQVVEKEVVKIVEVPGETVVVEKEVEVLRTVEVAVESIKEVVKVVEIHKTLLPDFGEAPQLAQLVAAGKLPPVQDRVSEDPLIITGQEIGRYGGSLRRVFTSASDHWNFGRMARTGLLRWTQDGQTLIPGVASAYEVSSDGTVWTFKLRKGMKWSDGMPFTADDFVYQFEEVISNDTLVPSKPSRLKVADNLGKVEKVDDLTVKFVFDAPNSLFGELVTQMDEIRGGANTLYAPTSYMQQFHADFAGQAAADKMAKDGGFETWVQHYQDKSDTMLNPDRPSTRPWLVTADITQPRMIGVRNPYFYGIDRAGNQLPYIDRLVFELVLDREMIVLKGVAGEIDMQGRHIQFKNFPVLKEGEEKGNYRVFQYGPMGLIQAALKFNMTFDGPEAPYMENKNFRIALSHAINRQEVNEILFYGLGQVRNHVAPRGSPSYPGDKFAKLYTEFDIELSNKMLDEILPNKDGDGFRLMPNGDRLNVIITTYQFADNNEMIANYWNAVGVHTEVNLVSRALCTTRHKANTNMVTGQGTQTLAQFSNPVFISPWAISACDAMVSGKHALWNASGGKDGVAPTGDILALLDLVKEGIAGTGEDRDRLGQEIGRLHAENQWVVSPIAAVPNPFIVSNNLGNVAEVAASVWQIRTPANTFPEVFFFRR